MANNITNELTFKNCSSERCREILEAVKLDEIGVGSIDFNKIIPQPKNLYMGNLGPEERKIYKNNNWYDWRCQHWGTKWNSYGYEENGGSFYEERNQIIFLSANSSAVEVIKALSKRYPDVLFELRYADEDFGYNTGAVGFRAGKITDFYAPEFGTKEAQEFAADVMGIELKFHPEFGCGYVLSINGDQFEYCEGVHISPAFQCDASLGHPVVLCYDEDNEKIWMESYRTQGEDLNELEKAEKQIHAWGIHSCQSWDEYNGYVQSLGEDAVAAAYHEQGEMTLC